MFVVVFLTKVKKRIVIPEQWIFDLNQQSLKNYGVNSNRNVLIFWSNSAKDADNRPDVSYAPNFTAPFSNAYPPLHDQACYLARLYFYRGE